MSQAHENGPPAVVGDQPRRTTTHSIKSRLRVDTDDTGKRLSFVENYPFVQQWSLKLKAGQLLYFQAEVKKYALKFYVNFTCGTEVTPDIAFHFAAHFHYYKLIRNSRINGFWGDEECSSGRRFPFRRRKRFSMQVLCSDDGFMVGINGAHTCFFSYRMPLDMVSALQIAGDIELDYLRRKKTPTYPITVDERKPHALILYKLSKLDNQQRPRYTPFMVSLPDGLEPPRKLIIFGSLKLFPSSFTINFQDESRIWPEPEIPFQIMVDVHPRGITVICSSYLKGKWGNDEKQLITVVRCGHDFIMRVACEADLYSIVINKDFEMQFKHRAPPDMVKGFMVQGDVYIDVIKCK